MKGLFNNLIFYGIIILMAFSCNDDDKLADKKDESYYIVGFDNCAVYGDGQVRLGLYITSTDLSKTLLTYNITDSSYKMPATVIMYETYDTLYQIPASYFQDYLGTAYFPDSVQNNFKLKIEYREAVGKELIYYGCPTHIYTGDFTNAIQVIIISASKIN